MKAHLAALGAGVTFGAGLAISGMTMPSKVIGFLDVAGAWDPSLIFVMIGAIGVHFVAHRLILRRSSPLFDTRFHVPLGKQIDGRLVIGSAIFGVGWGLAGYCPGPALVSAGAGSTAAWAFVLGMTAAMVIQNAMRRSIARRHVRMEGPDEH